MLEQKFPIEELDGALERVTGDEARDAIDGKGTGAGTVRGLNDEELFGGGGDGGKAEQLTEVEQREDLATKMNDATQAGVSGGQGRDGRQITALDDRGNGGGKGLPTEQEVDALAGDVERSGVAGCRRA